MKKKKKSPWLVFAAIVLAIFIGSWAGTHKEIFGITFYSVFDIVGNLFINALKLIVVPLVASSMITGIARIAGDESFGRLGLKTFGFYISTSLLAILIGLFFVNIIQPGLSHVVSEGMEISNHAALQTSGGILDVVMSIIPSNIVEVFQGQMLGLIFFSLLFGYAISKIDSHPSSILLGFWHGIFQAMLKITHIIMKFLPLGILPRRQGVCDNRPRIF